MPPASFSGMFYSLQTKNCMRSASAINPLTTEIMDTDTHNSQLALKPPRIIANQHLQGSGERNRTQRRTKVSP